MNVDEAGKPDRTNGEDHDRFTEPSSERMEHAERLRERRLQAADDAMDDALALPDPFQANLAASVANLGRVDAALGDLIAKELEDPEMSLERAAEMTPAIDLYLRVTRQFERHSQLERRDRESQPKNEETRSRRWRRLEP